MNLMRELRSIGNNKNKTKDYLFIIEIMVEEDTRRDCRF